MKRAPNRIAALADEIADRAGTIAPQDEKLRQLLCEMQELTRVLPTLRLVHSDPDRRNKAEVEDEPDDLFDNMPV